MLFDFEKFKKVCDYSQRPDKRETHLLDLNTPGGNDFLMFLDQRGIEVTDYARSVGYICWNEDNYCCWGIDPVDCRFINDVAITIHIISDFSMTTIQIDDDTMLDFLGV